MVAERVTGAGGCMNALLVPVGASHVLPAALEAVAKGTAVAARQPSETPVAARFSRFGVTRRML